MAKTYFELPKLPYSYDALEPLIDSQTMYLHHDKHHRAYVDKLNEALDESGREIPKNLGEIIFNISQWPMAVRNNGGGHWNHSFFWDLLRPRGQGGSLSPDLLTGINSAFGSFENFKKQFTEAGQKHFGSGYVWLVGHAGGQLEILTTPNQDNPIMDVAEKKGKPLLTCDLWEHAYYLKYHNERVEFIKAFWELVNWDKVNALFKT